MLAFCNDSMIHTCSENLNLKHENVPFYDYIIINKRFKARSTIFLIYNFLLIIWKGKAYKAL